MSGRYPTRAGAAAGASGMFTVTLVRPGPGRAIAEHWAYDDRAQALDDLGWIAERVAPGTEMVLKDPEGVELLRMAKVA
ncbi:hypothetical protein [Falsiroseomonas sp. CW058]|uniref:hypothetical protein n=1 Tax=Falsiroseomonas sp. CW058 TaxID=3388664 RepID=UPI003D3108E2